MAKIQEEDRRLRDRAVNLLMNLTIFSTWSTDRLYRLASKMTLIDCVHKQLIIEQGSSLDRVYFVLVGSVSLTRQIDLIRRNRLPVDRDHWDRLDAKITKSFVVDVVNEGDFFGDEAILGVKRSATSAVCLSQRSSILSLPRSAFIQLYQPTIMQYLQSRRLQSREYAFFKVYSSLKNCSSIKNLQTLDILDNDDIAFNEPIVQHDLAQREPVLTERGRLLRDPPLTRKVVIMRSSEARPRRSQSNVDLNAKQSSRRTKQGLSKSESEALLNRLSRPNDESFETGALIAIRAHLEAVLARQRNPVGKKSKG